MKLILRGRSIAAVMWLLFAQVGCREFTTVDRPYQRVLINDFSAPLRTLLPARTKYPASLTIRVSGTISQPVTLAVDLLTSGQGRQSVRRDTLLAGTYADKYVGGDFYSKEATELVVTGAPGTTGSLTIEWYAQ